MASETIQYVKVKVEVQALVTAADGAEQKIEYAYGKTFSDGTGTDQAGALWYKATRNLNATNEDIDLNGSASYTDFKGSALDLNALSVVLIENLDSDTGDYFELSQPASNGVTGLFKAAGDGIKIHPGGLLLWIAPGPDKATVTGTTADLLNLLAADNSNARVLMVGDNT